MLRIFVVGSPEQPKLWIYPVGGFIPEFGYLKI
jgi:hypothetical protein